MDLLLSARKPESSTDNKKAGQRPVPRFDKVPKNTTPFSRRTCCLRKAISGKGSRTLPSTSTYLSLGPLNLSSTTNVRFASTHNRRGSERTFGKEIYTGASAIGEVDLPVSLSRALFLTVEPKDVDSERSLGPSDANVRVTFYTQLSRVKAQAYNSQKMEPKKSCRSADGVLCFKLPALT